MKCQLVSVLFLLLGCAGSGAARASPSGVQGDTLSSRNHLRRLSLADMTSTKGKQAQEEAEDKKTSSSAGNAATSSSATAGGASGSSTTTASGGSTESSTSSTSTGDVAASTNSTTAKPSTSASTANVVAGGNAAKSTVASANSTHAIKPGSIKAARPASSNVTVGSNSTASLSAKHNQTVIASPSVNSTNTSSTNSTMGKEESSRSKSVTGNAPVVNNDTEDSDSHNQTYPLFHYEDIQHAYNYSSSSIKRSNVSNAFLNKVTPVALQKNLSTTKTPFLPSEQKQPDQWPKFTGAIFLVAAIGLVVASIVRQLRQNNRRRYYEEIQSLTV